MKRYYCFLLILCYLQFVSCGEEETAVPIPDNILSKEKMAQVITDIHIAEAEANLKTLPDSTSKQPIGFQPIFEADSITKEQYEESLSFYIEHPKLLNEVYEDVLNELSKRQAGKQ